MDELDDLFAQSRAAALQPSDALMRRVLDDAARVQPTAAVPVVRAATPATPGFWAGLAAFFGGGAALAGIGSAAVVGVFLGFVQPASLLAMTSSLTSGEALESLDLMPGVDALLAEE